jgi:hypothetical protein
LPLLLAVVVVVASSLLSVLFFNAIMGKIFLFWINLCF